MQPLAKYMNWKLSPSVPNMTKELKKTNLQYEIENATIMLGKPFL